MHHWVALLLVTAVLTVGVTRGQEDTPPPLYHAFNEIRLNHQMPLLGYQLEDLEPQMAVAPSIVHYFNTMFTLHSKMNNVIRAWRKEYLRDRVARMSLMNVMRSDAIEEEFKDSVHDSLGGYMNHVIMWSNLSPNKDYYPRDLMGPMRRQIEKSYGTYDNFKTIFNRTAIDMVGSGFVWLVRTNDGDLEITSTKNNANPLAEGVWPILAYDAWEHAHFIQYGTNKARALNEWWTLVEWDNVDALDRYWKEQQEANARELELEKRTKQMPMLDDRWIDAVDTETRRTTISPGDNQIKDGVAPDVEESHVDATSDDAVVEVEQESDEPSNTV